MADPTICRRRWLQGLGSAVLGAQFGRGLSACTGDEATAAPAGSAPEPSGESPQGPPATADASAVGPVGDASVCTLYPAQVEGPYYLDARLIRRDIAEGRPGVPLKVRVWVLGATCTPIANALVDLWHNDAGGVYSGYPGQVGNLDTTGETFLRGIQPTGPDGAAEFTTIYPGWYPGRTTHIHFKVHLAGRSMVTSQLYFPEEITAAVYASPAYARRGQKDTSNTRDGIAGRAAVVVAKVTGEVQAGYAAELTVVIA